MRLVDTAIPAVKIIESLVFEDDRGSFMEVWHAEKFKALGLDIPFVQDNHSISSRHVLRGLHYQVVRPQGKLVRCVAGEIFDVAVDLRRSSPTLGKSVGVILSGRNQRQLWIPPGFAHGFIALEDRSHVMYKCSDIYLAEHDRSIRWNDPDLDVPWPAGVSTPQLSAKDAAAPRFAEAELFP